eukprot:comp13155_c0_seq2/m.17884 comp13155_c0_seq2/g.17884  ORF comp13155_c0_seq2/g.17884 comp13155_c0_seq2/m.17884 type:complete len:211 (+) comp13155_c0_seq2:36-668(+)
MPPKKAGKKGGSAGKGKGKKKNPGEEPMSVEDELRVAKLRIEALENLLVTRSEQTNRAVAVQNELRNKVDEYNRDFEREKEDRFHITADMSRQYKAMQESLISKNAEQEKLIATLRDKLDEMQNSLDELRREKDQEIAKKDAEIREQKQKMEEMSIEFGDMLKETLDKMNEKMEMTKNNWDGDPGGMTSAVGNSGNAKSRLEDFNVGHND